MTAAGDHHRPAADPAVTDAFRQIAVIYVETSRELTESDPDLCLDVPEAPRRMEVVGGDSGPSQVAVD
ncbi:hypothetical protein [Candidatus Poriferisodalis sp.]|uniref:hypothetical protein n=1 Tax=Candidatus Poriferisodalis sp. TaxID=3101277 RepID=UPI003C6EB65B